MTDEAMSPLRRRMIEDMTIRKLAPKTQQGYIRTVKDFAAFLGRSPERRAWRTFVAFSCIWPRMARVPILNHTVAALRFFFRVTLRRSAIIEHTTFIHEPRKLPVVLSPAEVARLLDAAPGLKYKAALSVAYGAGLRAAEVVSLKVGDIDSPAARLHRVRPTACWARPPAPTTSRSPANCSQPKRPKANNLPRPLLPITTTRHVRIAAAEWSSSRPSNAAARRDSSQQHR